MGVLDDLKKLFFVNESIAKSAAEKTMEAGKEAGGKLVENAGELFDVAKDKMGDGYDMVKDKVGDLTDNRNSSTNSTSGKVADLGETMADKGSEVLGNAKDFTEDIGSKVLDATAPAVAVARDFTEDLGGKVLDKAGTILDKTKSLAEEVGGKILDKKEEFMENTKDVREDIASSTGEALDHVKDVYVDAGAKLKDKAADFYESAQAEGESEDISVTDKLKNFKDKASDFYSKAQEEGDKGTGTDSAIFDQLNKKATSTYDNVSGLAGTGANEMFEKANDFLGDTSKGVDRTVDNISDAAKTAQDGVDEIRTTGASGGLLGGMDDFFSKADRFAKGDYNNTGKKTTEEEPKEGDEDDILDLNA